MATIKEKAEAILNEKNEKIISDNLAENLTIFDISGNIPVVGTHYTGSNSIEEQPEYDILSIKGELPFTKMFFDDPEPKIIIEAARSDVADAIGLTSDKIKKGETILGIEGIVEEGDINDYIDFNPENPYQSLMFYIKKFPINYYVEWIPNDFAHGAGNLTSIEFKKNTETKATCSERSFYGCEKLQDLTNITIHFDDSYTANQMFRSCYKLKKLKLAGNFHPINNDSIYAMFQDCYELTQLGDTFKIYIDADSTSYAPTDASFIFSNCRCLTKIPIEDFSSVGDIQYAFCNCYSLEELDLSTLPYTNYQNGSFLCDSFLDGVPDNCRIYVSDEDMKGWLLTLYPNLINIEIKE